MADLMVDVMLHDFFPAVKQAPITKTVVPARLADKFMFHLSSYLEDHFFEGRCHGKVKRPCNPSQCPAVILAELRGVCQSSPPLPDKD